MAGAVEGKDSMAEAVEGEDFMTGAVEDIAGNSDSAPDLTWPGIHGLMGEDFLAETKEAMDILRAVGSWSSGLVSSSSDIEVVGRCW